MNRLIDDVSFEVLRTNPKLSTNVKLMVSRDGMFLSTFSADANLSKSSLKNVRISGDGFYNKDVYNFYRINKIEKASAYKVYNGESTLVMHDDFDKQYEMMYSAGAEYVNSKECSEEFGILAPLWVDKQLPRYFVVFKVDDPAALSVDSDDSDEYVNDRTTFISDILSRCEIIKTFDLSEKTKIGAYIHRYIQQDDFPQAPIYVSFDRNIPSRYYGFSYDTGVLMYSEESNSTNMLNTDRTQLDFDKFITDGYERNGIVCANLINIEFMFDDEVSDEYTINRYFGMYCDTLDFDLTTNTPSTQSIYAVDDMFGGLHSVNVFDQENVEYEISKHSGYDTTDVYNMHAVPINNNAMSAQLKLDAKDVVRGIGYTFYIKNGNSNDTELGCVIPYDPVVDGVSDSPLDFQISNSDVTVTARNFAHALNRVSTLFKAYAVGDYVYLIATSYGARFNDMYMVKDLAYDEQEQVVKNFCGGVTSSNNRCFFKTEKTENIEKFSRCDDGTYAMVANTFDYTLEPIYDRNGKFVKFNDIDKYSIIEFTKPNIQCNYNQISLYDTFASTLKVLSFYPIRDFDFSTHSTMYSKSVPYDNYGIGYNDMGSDYDIGESDSDTTDIVSETELAKLRNNFYIRMGGFPYLVSNITQSSILTEYDRLNENYIYENAFCNASKTIPYINKWSYFDGGLDARHNPYRLNANLAFGANNFSPNANAQLDQNAFTHEWYYIYDSINNDSVDFGTLLQDIEHDYFTDYFLDGLLPFSNTHNGKKYSRFHFGSQSSYSETMFNGVRVVAKPRLNDTAYYSDEFNGYRFSVILNITDHTSVSPIDVIKNDTYKFVVVVVNMNFVTLISTESLSPDTIYGYDYYRTASGKLVLPFSGTIVGFDIEDVSAHTYKIYGDGTLFTNEFRSTNGQNETYTIIDADGNEIARIVDVVDDNVAVVELCDYVDDDGIVRMRDIYDIICRQSYINGNGIGIYVDKIKRFSFSEIVSSINSGVAHYYDDGFTLLIEPQQTYHKASYLNAPYVTNSFGINIGCELVATTPQLYLIHRHSGYYAPMSYDVVPYSDTYTNTMFDTQCENFGIIKDLYYHKVRLDLDYIMVGGGEQYPLIGIDGIDREDHYVFGSNWDSGYYNGYIGGTKYPIAGTRSMIEKKSYMGSKLANVPDTLTIDIFDADAYTITEANGKVDIHLHIDDVFVKYMFEKLYDVFSKYVNPYESVGSPDTIDDDIYIYVMNNLKRLYNVSDICMQIKREYEGETNIDLLYMDKSESDRIIDGMVYERSFDISQSPNTFDKTIRYIPKKGYRTYIGFVVKFNKM